MAEPTLKDVLRLELKDGDLLVVDGNAVTMDMLRGWQGTGSVFVVIVYPRPGESLDDFFRVVRVEKAG